MSELDETNISNRSDKILDTPEQDKKEPKEVVNKEGVSDKPENVNNKEDKSDLKYPSIEEAEAEIAAMFSKGKKKPRSSLNSSVRDGDFNFSSIEHLFKSKAKTVTRVPAWFTRNVTMSSMVKLHDFHRTTHTKYMFKSLSLAYKRTSLLRELSSGLRKLNKTLLRKSDSIKVNTGVSARYASENADKKNSGNPLSIISNIIKDSVKERTTKTGKSILRKILDGKTLSDTARDLKSSTFKNIVKGRSFIHKYRGKDSKLGSAASKVSRAAAWGVGNIPGKSLIKENGRLQRWTEHASAAANFISPDWLKEQKEEDPNDPFGTKNGYNSFMTGWRKEQISLLQDIKDKIYFSKNTNRGNNYNRKRESDTASKKEVKNKSENLISKDEITIKKSVNPENGLTVRPNKLSDSTKRDIREKLRTNPIANVYNKPTQDVYHNKNVKTNIPNTVRENIRNNVKDSLAEEPKIKTNRIRSTVHTLLNKGKSVSKNALISGLSLLDEVKNNKSRTEKPVQSAYDDKIKSHENSERNFGSKIDDDIKNREYHDASGNDNSSSSGILGSLLESGKDALFGGKSRGIKRNLKLLKRMGVKRYGKSILKGGIKRFGSSILGGVLGDGLLGGAKSAGSVLGEGVKSLGSLTGISKGIGGVKGLAKGALSIGKMGKGLLKGGLLGIAGDMALDTADGGIDKYTKKGGLANRAGHTATAAGRGAMWGATIGSVIPGLGTAVGAGIGAAAGAIYENSDLLTKGFHTISKSLFGKNSHINSAGKFILDAASGGALPLLTAGLKTYGLMFSKDGSSVSKVDAKNASVPDFNNGNNRSLNRAANDNFSGTSGGNTLDNFTPAKAVNSIQDDPKYINTLKNLPKELADKLSKTKNQGLTYAVWSTAKQFGPKQAADIVTKVSSDRPNMSEDELIKNIFQVRATSIGKGDRGKFANTSQAGVTNAAEMSMAQDISSGKTSADFNSMLSSTGGSSSNSVEVNQSDAAEAASRKRLPRGERNNNPGNIRYAGQKNARPEFPGSKDPGFAVFNTMEDGVAEMRNQIGRYQTDAKWGKLDTIYDIIGKWAPPNENNTRNYIQHVADALKVKPTQHLGMLNAEQLSTMMKAITSMEDGSRSAKKIYPSIDRVMGPLAQQDGSANKPNTNNSTAPTPNGNSTPITRSNEGTPKSNIPSDRNSTSAVQNVPKIINKQQNDSISSSISKTVSTPTVLPRPSKNNKSSQDPSLIHQKAIADNSNIQISLLQRIANNLDKQNKDSNSGDSRTNTSEQSPNPIVINNNNNNQQLGMGNDSLSFSNHRDTHARIG